MTNKFQEIKARAEKATSGPWSHETAGYIEVYSEHPEWESANAVCEIAEDIDDAEFIASSRTDIPLLLRALVIKQIVQILRQLVLLLACHWQKTDLPAPA